LTFVGNRPPALAFNCLDVLLRATGRLLCPTPVPATWPLG
jgi:hypothetical protein